MDWRGVRKGSVRIQSNVLGSALHDFLLEFWMGIAHPSIPKPEDLAAFMEPYIDFLQAEASQSAIMFIVSDEFQKKSREFSLTDYLKQIQAEKEEAMMRIERERKKRGFADRHTLPET
jgi:hypothetical protein